MAQVAVRPMLLSGGEPNAAAMNMLKKRNALASLEGLGAWSDTFQNLTTTFGGALSQVLLNKNQAVSVQTSPYGSTVYYPAGSTTAPVMAGSPSSSNTMLWVIGGIAAVAIVMVMSKR